MNFLRLQEPLLTVLFEDEDIIAINKPYGFNAHTNDSKIENSEFIQDGLIEIFEKQRATRLHIIHRLDQTTTGVMIFGKSVDSAKKYAEFFLQRKVKKTYWFITRKSVGPTSFLIDKTIIHKAKELDAKTQLTLLKTTIAASGAHFSLWQANPFTGRNHQIRIHAEVAGIPILGDSKYNGDTYPFLCLHNHRIEFPNGIIISSAAPEYYENLELLSDIGLTRTLFEIDRRQRLFGNLGISSNAGNKVTSCDNGFADQCYRLVHNRSQNKDAGFTLDQFGKVLVLTWFNENWGEGDLRRFTFIAKFLHKIIIVKIKQQEFLLDPSIPVQVGEPLFKSWQATEANTIYELRREAGHSVGLFLNQRLQRNWILQNAKGKSVLNLFAQTCGFGLAAALGKAQQVISVDLNKNLLNWGRVNFGLNKLNLEDSNNFIFLCRDSLSYLEQCRSKKNQFDLIICEVPAFFRREKGSFKIEAGLEALLKNALECLNPNGQVLFSTQADGFLIDDINKVFLKLKNILKLSELNISCLLPSMDFELADEKVGLKSFLVSGDPLVNVSKVLNT